MDKILQSSHQNTLKKRRLLRTMVVEDEVPSFQLVELNAEDTSQTVEETPVVETESRRSNKVKSKGHKVVVAEELSEGLGAIDKRSKGKTIMDQSSKGLTLLLAQKEADLALLKVEEATQGTSGKSDAMLDLQNKNAQLKDKNTALKK
ncbi:hypothetical protein HAX54_019270 [Datura stramonium]|uniref:Uncharacterized protein n=1 Tax=Datura stramonium TaxID=4076 RepID=A0ABS8S2F8_DATST|nr:hypothetical protein [Datura stramonium]